MSTVVPLRRRDFAITSHVAHAATGWRRLPKGVRERTDLFANHSFMKKAVARVGGPNEVKQALRSAASGGNPFLDACRIAMFRLSKCRD